MVSDFMRHAYPMIRRFAQEQCRYTATSEHRCLSGFFHSPSSFVILTGTHNLSWHAPLPRDHDGVAMCQRAQSDLRSTSPGRRCVMRNYWERHAALWAILLAPILSVASTPQGNPMLSDRGAGGLVHTTFIKFEILS